MKNQLRCLKHGNRQAGRHVVTMLVEFSFLAISVTNQRYSFYVNEVNEGAQQWRINKKKRDRYQSINAREKN